MKKLNTRFINIDNFSKLGTIVSYILATLLLVQLCLTIGVNYSNLSNDYDFLITYTINTIFYIMIAGYFNKGKNNFYYIFYAILLLILGNYIIPIIMSILRLDFTSFIFIPLLISSILAILYFIFLALENKKREKKYFKALMVVGLIFGIAAFIYGIFNIVIYSIFMVELIGNLKEMEITTNQLLAIFGYIVLILTNLVETVAIPILFGIYPFILKKERLY